MREGSTSGASGLDPRGACGRRRGIATPMACRFGGPRLRDGLGAGADRRRPPCRAGVEHQLRPRDHAGSSAITASRPPPQASSLVVPVPSPIRRRSVRRPHAARASPSSPPRRRDPGVSVPSSASLDGAAQGALRHAHAAAVLAATFAAPPTMHRHDLLVASRSSRRRRPSSRRLQAGAPAELVRPACAGRRPRPSSSRAPGRSSRARRRLAHRRVATPWARAAPRAARRTCGHRLGRSSTPVSAWLASSCRSRASARARPPAPGAPPCLRDARLEALEHAVEGSVQPGDLPTFAVGDRSRVAPPTSTRSIAPITPPAARSAAQEPSVDEDHRHDCGPARGSACARRAGLVQGWRRRRSANTCGTSSALTGELLRSVGRSWGWGQTLYRAIRPADTSSKSSMTHVPPRALTHRPQRPCAAGSDFRRRPESLWRALRRYSF